MDKKLGEVGISVASAVIIAVIITGIVVGAGVYVATPKGVTKTVTKTVTEEVPPKVKAGFIYVGPIGDFGWTFAHNRGRRLVDDKYDWLETIYVEAVAEADVGGVIDMMFEEGADVVFATSYGYGWELVTAAKERWPDKILYLAAGGHPDIHGSAPNVGFCFVDYHQCAYLNGLAAGALTKTNKIGYILALELPEPIRAANVFHLGAKEVNPNVEGKAVVIGSWYDPGAEATAFDTLVAWGADVIMHTTDSPAVVEKAQTRYEETGERVWTFSHYSPMKHLGPDVILSGQLAHWEKWYEPLLLKAQQGEVENWIHWGGLAGCYTEVGVDFGEPIKPDMVDDLKAVTVTDPVLGEINVYDLIMHRLEQFKGNMTVFNIFTGPIYDSEGNLKLKDGEIISEYELNWTMDWYVEGIIPP